MEKINRKVMKQWIEQRITSILGFDDEIVSSTAINLFLPEEDLGVSPDPKRAQLDLVGFLGDSESATFATEVWNLMLEAETSPAGIPRTLLEKKKQELAANQKKKASQPSNPSQNRVSNHPNASSRNPEMNRFMQEAERRAQAAREMVGPAQQQLQQENPAPVSPSYPSEEAVSQHRQDSNRHRDKNAPRHDDRKMPPRRRPPEPHMNHPRSYGREDDRGHRSYRSSPRRSFSPDQYRAPRGGRMDDRGRRDEWGRAPYENRRHRYYDEEDEFQQLESRLVMLERRHYHERHNYALQEEMEDIKDRLYELSRRRRRYNESGHYHGRRERSSPPRSNHHRNHHDQPSKRRHRSRSRDNSEERRRRRRSESSDSRSDTSDSESSRSTVSRSNSRSRSHDRRRRHESRDRGGRRSRDRRGYSSESNSSMDRSADGSHSDR